MCLFDHFKKKKQHYDLFIVFVFMFLYLSLRPILQYLFQQKVVPCSTSHSSCSLCCTSHCVTICCSKVCLSLQHSSQPLWHSSTKPVSGRWPASLRDIFTNVKAFRLCVFKSHFFSALYNTHFQRIFSVKNRKISAVEQLNRRQ